MTIKQLNDLILKNPGPGVVMEEFHRIKRIIDAEESTSLRRAIRKAARCSQWEYRHEVSVIANNLPPQKQATGRWVRVGYLWVMRELPEELERAETLLAKLAILGIEPRQKIPF